MLQKHCFSNDGAEFHGSVYQRVHSDLETGVQLDWTSGSNATKFGLAAKYTVDPDTNFRVRIYTWKIINSVL